MAFTGKTYIHAAEDIMKEVAVIMETVKDAAADMERDMKEDAAAATTEKVTDAAIMAKAAAIKTNSLAHVAFTGIHIGRTSRTV